MSRQVLCTGPDPTLLLHLRSVLGRLGYSCESIPLERAPAHPFHIAMVDARRRSSLQRLRTLAGRALVIALAEPGQEALSHHAGADVVITSTEPSVSEIEEAIQRGAELIGRPIDGPLGHIIGRSPPLRLVLRRIESYAQTSATVLIVGETGTGKELIARAIHLLSARRAGPFIPVNCAAIPESLAESEVFGHARGAFTGATSARPGRIAAAEGGTLFLDEIGELSLQAQAKLLRLLQEREYTPVGENLPRKADVRIVAATNRDLHREVQAGRFRADLYWRLEVITIEVPTLRQRIDDVMPLVHHIIDRTNHAHQLRTCGIVPAAQQLLLAHDWPGNVRELENTIERAVILRSEGPLREEDIILRRRTPPSEMLGHVRLPPDGLDLMETTAALETLLIDQALEQTGGNRTQAARLLNINRTTLIEKLRRREEMGR
ncbi:MAG: sigma 54-interacting transcriptional regulator [Myxococcales bacterium]|nr:sigma 54-interacting transcriptional regulator [Myxococcota bacterium]MDW8282828.1 sigma 54-interacting transcriptional regulator [Myxococcales bacterium]